MAALSKGALRTLTRALLRDNEKQAWHDSILDIIIGQSMDSIASNVIDFAPDFFSTRENILASSFVSGAYDLSLLSARFYRMQALTRNGQEFYPAKPTSVTMDPNIGTGVNSVMTSPQFSYFIRGQLLWMFPFDTTTTTSIVYSYMPPDFLTLADATVISWPQGFEMLIAHDAALQIVDDEFRSTKFSTLRNEKLDALYSKVKRSVPGSAVMNSIDDGLAWSSI